MHQFMAKMRAQVMARVRDIKVQECAGGACVNSMDFMDIFKKKPAVIAEIKFSSPSLGKIYPGALSVLKIAEEYLSSGAAALSILTEPTYFNGSIESIRAVRAAYPKAYILQKDFILSRKQIDEGLAAGANAVLLIAAFLSKDELFSLYEYAINCGLVPLVEVHHLAELEFVLPLKPKLIGINHRNLDTLHIDLEISRALIDAIPKATYVVAESGIHTAKDYQNMMARGFHGCLIGTSFMRHDNPGRALKTLLDACDAT